MKKLLIKVLIEIYYKFDVVLRKIIPLSWRVKIRFFLSKRLNKTPSSSNRRKNHSESLPGVNLVGSILGESGLGQGCRLLAKAIDISGVDWLAISSDRSLVDGRGDNTWAHKLEAEPQYNTNIVHLNPDLLYLINLYLPQKLWEMPYSIGYCVCELEEVQDEWVVGLDFFDEIWCPSQFVVDAVKKRTDKPVIKVPYGISAEDYTSYGREHFGLPGDIFLFLTMYDTYSTTDRKNPMGAINAFKEAFKPNENQVGLVVKINDSKQSQVGELSALRDALKEYSNVFFIENTLDKSEVNSLIYCCDCTVSLHRAEGFGLVPAEAMYVGRPAISTDWSATAEYVNESNACPVRYKLIKIEKDIGNYKAGMFWADPDITHAASYMKRLYSDKEYYDMIASEGKDFIRQNFSHEKCSEIIKSRLEELGLIG